MEPKLLADRTRNPWPYVLVGNSHLAPGSFRVCGRPTGNWNLSRLLQGCPSSAHNLVLWAATISPSCLASRRIYRNPKRFRGGALAGNEFLSAAASRGEPLQLFRPIQDKTQFCLTIFLTIFLDKVKTLPIRRNVIGGDSLLRICNEVGFKQNMA
jgi:hypothetical protein